MSNILVPSNIINITSGGGIIPNPAELSMDDIQEPIIPLGVQHKSSTLIIPFLVPIPISSEYGYFRKTGRLSGYATATENIDGSVTYANNGIAGTSVGQAPFCGHVSRFFIEPAANGEIEFILRVSNINSGIAGGNSGDALAIGGGHVSPYSLNFVGIGRDGFTFPNPRNINFHLLQWGGPAPSIIKGTDQIAVSTWDLKYLYLSTDLSVNGPIYTYHWISLDGGAYANISLAGTRNNKHVASLGIRVLVGIMMNRNLTSFSGIVQNFQLVQGFIVPAENIIF
jgi:hypothetical protein